MPRSKKNAKVTALNAITRSLAKNRRTIAKSNPELANFAGLVLPATGAYVGTRMASNMLTGILAGRAPRLAKHAKPLSSAALLALIWFVSKKSKTVNKYRDGLLAGAAIAAIQAIITTYVPALAGLFSDVKLLPAATVSSGYSAAAGTAPVMVVPGELDAAAAEQELANDMPPPDEADDYTGVFAQN